MSGWMDGWMDGWMHVLCIKGTPEGGVDSKALCPA